MFNVLVPLINNTPVRDLLNIVDPPGTPGATVIRLAGTPSSAVLSPTGNLLFELTVPPNPLGGIFYVPPTYSTLTVINTATNTVVGVPVNVRGVPIGAPVISADGTRAYQSSSVAGGVNTTYVTVIDTASGNVVGKPIRLDGWSAGSVVLSADGHYAYQATTISVGSVFTTAVSAIDTKKVATVGDPVSVQGWIRGSMVRNLDATRLCLTTTDEVAVIDTSDMSLVAPPIAVDGSPNGGVVASPDGTRAVVTTDRGNFPDNTVVVTLVDLASGSVIGTPTVIEGFTNSTAAGIPIFSDGGARLNQITGAYDQNTKTSSTVLTIIDSSTGNLVGAPIALPGNDTRFMAVQVPDPADSHLFVASGITQTYDSMVITVVDTSDGTVVGTPLVTGYGTLVSAPGGNSVYVSAGFGGSTPTGTEVSVVDSDGVTTGTSRPLFSPPIALLASPGGSRVYQLTAVGSHIQIFALDAVTAAGSSVPVSVGGTVNSALITPDGTKIYDTNNGSSPLLSLSFPYRVTVVKTSAIR
ncbi:hypothetical protein [Mycolicibacterium rhodesiae]|uniref:YVTN family beta-propeller repeat protein n=1 Tax=Mycolicibacterium rhodesiae TaxID=36814 RepID=A0A1X0J1E2_MYCRH|nr:hypothetical protein [Mycolicibacterium rhodesiae]MCV7345190.1 hypothetical protein [Mycolicibacterium rhodesiae]ORB54825.1 hypothetical protein BST42_08490 [Mycolicibacterium rhodesiae]